MWGVSPQLPAALEVIAAWGFEFKTIGFVWVKTNEKAEAVQLSGEGLHWGLGYHTRTNTEFCLLATRGSPQRDAKDVHQVVVAPVGAHSVKPEEVRKRIEQLMVAPTLSCSPAAPSPGWTAWGDE